MEWKLVKTMKYTVDSMPLLASELAYFDEENNEIENQYQPVEAPIILKTRSWSFGFTKAS